MSRIALIASALVSLASASCATGVVTDENNTSPPLGGHDSGTFKPTQDSGTTNPTPPQQQQDSGSMNTNPCTGTMCGGQCVDTTSDSQNCGSCGNTCPTSAMCTGGTCQCSSGTLCSGSCVDTQTDSSNCGSCGKTCTTSETCKSGTCTPNVMSNAPPQGSCSHSLCTSGASLSDGCDTLGCTSVICDDYGDTYCCSTKWDSTCISEVTAYCSPYSCP